MPSSAVAIPPEAGTDVSASEQKRTPKPTSVSETVSEAPPFSVDAALAPSSTRRARAPQRLSARTRSSRRRNPPPPRRRGSDAQRARELYYASYKAAMQEATASLNRSDASAVLAAAAARRDPSAGASSEGASAGPSPSRVEPSPNPARRRADAALARPRGERDRATARREAPGDGVRASTREAYARDRRAARISTGTEIRSLREWRATERRDATRPSAARRTR